MQSNWRAASLFAVALLSSAVAFSGSASAQGAAASKDYTPSVGQPGKDVMWVPTPQALVERMLDMAGLAPEDTLIDLGSGDGRTVIAAARRGARALGIEYNADMVELSRRNALAEGVAERASFVQADIFKSDFSKATVLTMFLLEEINLQLRPAILDLRPGTRVVSNTFTMGEWAADQTANATSDPSCRAYCNAYLWIVPAKAAGTWQLPQGELVLAQEFQKLSGELTTGGRSMSIANGRLRGDRIAFEAGGVEYSGRVDGDRIEGSGGGGTAAWTAVRAPRLP